MGLRGNPRSRSRDKRCALAGDCLSVARRLARKSLIAAHGHLNFTTPWECRATERIFRDPQPGEAVARPCGRCGGSGLLSQRGCQACGGLGQVSRSDLVEVPVPAGIADLARLRVAGRGNAGRGGGPPGDVYVTVRVEEHPLFRRDGDDLHLVVPVAVHEAALGARIDIPVLEGTARLRVPPGTQTGQRLRLRGRGAPSPRDGRRGDLVAEIRITLPRVLDERSKDLLRQFGELHARDDVRESFVRLGS